ncbi:S-layer homology domain-containing protein [Paenibacillus puerhi]|uniref:S-layer homology domain-containing protein n=1 Tax=Paenibacillus puerhi TaxID=2692622 RepID=UPI00135C7D9F|nr:carboxypeptidase regulatory-like domain-containing protein [Paenibacillus puerhi]
MRKHASWKWLQLMLAFVLLFGSGLPAVRAEVKELNGLVAVVEDEQGNPLSSGYVTLYEHVLYTNGGDLQGYANQVYTASLRNGELFIPNAFILSGKSYEIVAGRYSYEGESKPLLYHYSFTGGDIRGLDFSSGQLKQYVFQHDKNAEDGNLVLVPQAGNGSKNIELPAFNGYFDQERKVTMWAASNVGFKAYAYVWNQESKEYYYLQKAVPAAYTSGQVIPFDGDLVEITPPETMPNAHITINSGYTGVGYFGKKAYASKGSIGRVEFASSVNNWNLHFGSSPVSFDQDMVWQADRDFTGKIEYTNAWGSPQLGIDMYVSYKDSYNNQLINAWYSSHTVSGGGSNPTSLWVATADDQGNPSRSLWNEDGSSTSLNSTGSGSGSSNSGGGSGGGGGYASGTALIYELYDANDNLLGTYPGISTYYLRLEGVPKSDSYRLKLAETLLPDTVVKPSLDQTFTISNEGSTQGLTFRLPEGYSSASRESALFMELDNGQPASTSMFGSGTSATLPVNSPIKTDKDYRIIASLLLTNENRVPLASYFVNQVIPGSKLQAMKEIPVQPNLVKTSIIHEPTAYFPFLQHQVKASIPQWQEGFSFQTMSTLFTAPGELEAHMIGRDDTTGYHVAQALSIPAQDSYTVSFGVDKQSMVPVELGASFNSFTVVNSRYQSVPYLGLIWQGNGLNKLYTTPGTYEFRFARIEQEAFENDWAHIWTTGSRNYTNATTLEFGTEIQPASFAPISQYAYTQDGREMLHLNTSALIRKGDYSLNQVLVERGNGYQYYSKAVIDKRPFESLNEYYRTINGTLRVVDSSGKLIFSDERSTTDNLYAQIVNQPDDYTLTYSLPIGPNKDITFSEALETGNTSEPPGKPQPKASFAGQGLKLSWEAAARAASYEVYAAERGQAMVKVAEGVKSTSYVYEAAQAGKTYELKVVAVSGKGLKTESDVISYSVPEFGASELKVGTQAIESTAGLLPIGGELVIELQGTAGDGIEAYAEVTVIKDNAEDTKKIALSAATGKYKGIYPIEPGITEVKRVKAYLIKPESGVKTPELTAEPNKKVGATISGIIKRDGQVVTDRPIVRISVGSQYVSGTAKADGTFDVAGVPEGKASISVISQGEYDTNLVTGLDTQYGRARNIETVHLSKTIKIRLIDQETQEPLSKALRVSIAGNVNKEGYVGSNGWFTTYSGETELKRFKVGSYTITIAGEGVYAGKTETIIIDGNRNYVSEPLKIVVGKKTKDLVNVNLKVFMPGDDVQTNVLESFSLYSPSAIQAFGWDAGYKYGYQRTMNVSERVYGPNPLHVLHGGASSTVQEEVYGRYGSIALTDIAASDDYALNISVPEFQQVYQSVQVTPLTGELLVVLKPAVTYQGRIINENGVPVANADVSASGSAGYAYARTDAEGRYSLKGLGEAGQLYLNVQAVGYVNYSGQQVADGSHTLADITLENDQFIHGKIVDKDGKPLKHVYVYASKPGSSGGWARTDQDGYFKIRGLAPGTYSVNANLYGYPSVTKNLAADNNEVTIALVSDGGIFAGAGNSFDSSVSTVVYGKEMTYRLSYKNNSSSAAGSVVWNFELPNSVKLVEGSVELNGKLFNASPGGILQVPVGNLEAGKQGVISFKVLVKEALEPTIRTSAYATVEGAKQQPELIATTGVLYVTLNAPAVTGDKRIKVYGNTKAGSIVEVFAGSVRLGRVVAEGRWWHTDVLLPVTEGNLEQEFKLTARVVDGDSAVSLSQTSDIATVIYSADVTGIQDVTVTAGWNSNVKLNPDISVATMAITEFTPIQVNVTFEDEVDEAFISFIGSTHKLTRSADGRTFKGEVPYGWSSYGEQLLTLTYKRNGISITVPLIEVIVLIDPSGYVFEGSMDNRLQGVTAVVQQRNPLSGLWSSWLAEKFGQVNPQVTDNEGRYGWDVLQGDWRVLFSKQGFEDYTSRIVVVPPAETQLNVPLVRTSAPKVERIVPADKEEKVNVNAEVEIVFDRPMDEASIDTKKVRLIQMEGTREVADVAYDLVLEHMAGYKVKAVDGGAGLEDGNQQTGWFEPDNTQKLSKTLVLKPKAPLTAGKSYQVVIEEGLLDYSGKPLETASMATFTTAVSVEQPKSTTGGGGGGAAPSEAANEALLDIVMLNKALSGNEVKLTLTEKQDTLVVKGDIWNTIQTKGYTIKLQKQNNVVTIPSQAFKLTDNETLLLEMKATGSSYPVGYKAASTVLRINLTKKQSDGKQVNLASSEPLVLKLAASSTREPALLGAYEFKGTQPIYIGRKLDIELLASGTFGLASFERAFTDVDSHWAESDIRFLVSHHIVDGVSETEFDPSGFTTRGQIAKLFAEMLQLDKSSEAATFKDVPADAWYADYVAAVEQAGIFQGADGLFRPDAAISRQEMAVVISRLVKQSGQSEQSADRSFVDQADIAEWAQEGVGTAVKLGIIQGDEAGKFLPAAKATRAEAATMIRRLIQVLE